MDSDRPDLAAVLRLVKQYEGILVLDVAHDFGAMGEHGLGLLESLEGGKCWPDIIVGSFSKTFASNGGFVAAAESTIDYLRVHSPALVFSSAISPVQVGIVAACCDVAFSPEGRALRAALEGKSIRFRDELVRRGFQTCGIPSPIVIVHVGDESTARLISRSLEALGLLVNLVEFPAVPKGQARLRFQLSPAHRDGTLDRAAAILDEARRQVQ